VSEIKISKQLTLSFQKLSHYWI